MKTTAKGYRISINGSIIDSIEEEAFKSNTYLGQSVKENGTYYFFNRKQGEIFIYLP
jgi:hypothetical protein